MILPDQINGLAHAPILPEMLRYGRQLVKACFPGEMQTEANERIMDHLVLLKYANRQEVEAYTPPVPLSGTESRFLASVHAPEGLYSPSSSALPGAAFGGSLLDRQTLAAYLWFVQASLDLEDHWEDGIRKLGLHAREDGIRYFE